MSALPQPSPATRSGWHAELALTYERSETRTVLGSRSHRGPLRVQRPFYPEGDVCHTYIVHPPGGIVGGDSLKLHADLCPGTHALITTPAATKFYRTLETRRAILDQSLNVHAATLEWLPQETIFFDHARAIAKTRVTLHEASKFIGWEVSIYGRPAANESFDHGEANQAFELWLGDRPLLLDRLKLSGRDGSMRARWGLAGSSALGTLLAYPANEQILEAVRHFDCACTLVDRVLVCRHLDGGDATKSLFIELWRTLRPLVIGREAVAPRIWAT